MSIVIIAMISPQRGNLARTPSKSQSLKRQRDGFLENSLTPKKQRTKPCFSPEQLHSDCEREKLESEGLLNRMKQFVRQSEEAEMRTTASAQLRIAEAKMTKLKEEKEFAVRRTKAMEEKVEEVEGREASAIRRAEDAMRRAEDAERRASESEGRLKLIIDVFEFLKADERFSRKGD